jgi:hypothetical protein
VVRDNDGDLLPDPWSRAHIDMRTPEHPMCRSKRTTRIGIHAGGTRRFTRGVHDRDVVAHDECDLEYRQQADHQDG